MDILKGKFVDGKPSDREVLPDVHSLVGGGEHWDEKMGSTKTVHFVLFITELFLSWGGLTLNGESGEKRPDPKANLWALLSSQLIFGKSAPVEWGNGGPP